MVELLEDGLRVSDDDPPGGRNPGDAGSGDEQRPVVGIDLGDTPVIDLDADD